MLRVLGVKMKRIINERNVRQNGIEDVEGVWGRR